MILDGIFILLDMFLTLQLFCLSISIYNIHVADMPVDHQDICCN